MSLRTDLIEAKARQIARWEYPELWGSEGWDGLPSRARIRSYQRAETLTDLDLDLLTERADDIPLPFRFAVDPIVAVLRNPGSQP